MTCEELNILNDEAKVYLSKLDDALTSRMLVINTDGIYVMNPGGVLTLINMQVLVRRLRQKHYYIANPEKFKELQYDNKD